MSSSAYIVIDPHKRVSLVSHPDNFLIDSHSGYGIGVVRELILWSQTKPFSHTFKVALICQAHELGVEAQNALLKTLEEPPPHTTVLLTTPHESMLLPTVVSRCERIGTIENVTKSKKWSQQLTTTKDKDILPPLPTITSEKNALHEAEKLSKIDRSKIAASLDLWGYELARRELLHSNDVENSLNMLALCETKKRIDANGNVQLNLELFFLHMAQNKTCNQST